MEAVVARDVFFAAEVKPQSVEEDKGGGV